MRTGETKRVTIQPEQGYGDWSAAKVANIPLIREQSRFLLLARRIEVPTPGPP